MTYCSAVKDQYGLIELEFALGPYRRDIQIHVNLADYLVSGSELGYDDDNCYIPIFVVNPVNNIEANNHWFLGNMFMDRYFVSNDYEIGDKLSVTKKKLP